MWANVIIAQVKPIALPGRQYETKPIMSTVYMYCIPFPLNEYCKMFCYLQACVF